MTESSPKPMTAIERYEYLVRIRYIRRFGRFGEHALPATPAIQQEIRDLFHMGVSANDTVSYLRVLVKKARGQEA